MPYTEYVFDLEADNLLDDVTKVHCIVLSENDKVISFPPDKIQDGLKLMSKADKLIGHNIIYYDLRVLEKVCNWKYEGESHNKYRFSAPTSSYVNTGGIGVNLLWKCQSDI